MSVWVKGNLDRTMRRKLYKLHDADAWNFLDVSVDVDTVEDVVDRLKSMGLIPNDAFFYAYEVNPQEICHNLYFMHQSFPEIKPGDMITPEILDVRKALPKR